jgi:hypothetical protein
MADMQLQILWLVLIATIVWALSMAVEASSFRKSHNSGLIGRFDSPVVMLELAQSRQAFSAIIDQGPRDQNIRTMRINTYMDFVFIVLYCLTLILLVAVNSNTSILTTAAFIGVVATGILDCWENSRLLGLFKTLESGATIEAPLPWPVSLAKWGLFAFDLALVGVALLQARSRHGNLALLAMAVFVFLASGLTALGLLRNRIISVSVLCLFPALLIGAWVWKPWHT